MKKKNVIIVVSFLIVILGIIFAFVTFSNNKKNDNRYTIKVELIDNYSPDRRVEVYDKNNKKVGFKEIYHTNGVYLCKESRPIISKIELLNVSELKVKLENDEIITATILKEEE